MIYRALKKTVQKILLAALSIYSDYLSYFLPASCRFYPSCSHYAHDAIKEHGNIYGIYISIRRLLRCHPWNEGGFDPVPKSRSILDLEKKNGESPCCNKQGNEKTALLQTPNLSGEYI